MPFVQTGRRLTISTPLGDDRLLLNALSGVEGISQLFQFEAELLSEDDAVRFDAIVGQKVSVTIEQADGSERYWNGYVSRFSQGSRDRKLTSYRAAIVPWLWFLSRTADCRIFQKKKAPDIIQQIFRDLGFQDFELRLYGSFVEREYCVQYRETDFNFVSRLMEEEGIYYFFVHEKDKHTLILANDPSAHQPCGGQSKVRFVPVSGGKRNQDTIEEWQPAQEFRPVSYSLTDYNFETPSASLAVSVPGRKAYDIYDYPGEYGKRNDGDALARIRMQEQAARGLVIHGASDCRQFTTGHTFELTDHYRADMNKGYLLTAVRHIVTQGGYETVGSGDGAGGLEFSYRNTFECIPDSVPFRPPRVTPQPFVQGCQTAVVVGPQGEEIYTDQYGRVKVQFHWDREGQRNENSSCWIRVSHPWAGKGWGGIQIPRIGQEVIVDFLEGNADQPIIVGRVYHAESMPPFPLPAQAMVSGVKSDSTKGGGGYNQISLDDTKGNELIHIHAQYDQDKKVEHDERVNVGNDRTESVGHDETITIGNNRTEKVGVDEKITIGSNRTESVGVNEKIDIGANRTETVGGNEMITVALTRTRNVGVNEMVNIGAAQEVTIGGLQMISVGAVRNKTVGASETVNIGANQSVTIGANQSVNVESNQSTKVGSNRSASVGKDDAIQVGKNLTVNAGDQIVLKTGSASITMKKDGTIAIQGKDITIKGSGKINVKASKNIVMKGQKILEN